MCTTQALVHAFDRKTLHRGCASTVVNETINNMYDSRKYLFSHLDKSFPASISSVPHSRYSSYRTDSQNQRVSWMMVEAAAHVRVHASTFLSEWHESSNVFLLASMT